MDKPSWTAKYQCSSNRIFHILNGFHQTSIIAKKKSTYLKQYTDILLILSLHRSKLTLVYLPFRNYALMIDGSLVQTSICLISKVGFQIDLLEMPITGEREHTAE